MNNYDHIHHPGDARQPVPLPQFVGFNDRVAEMGVNNANQAIAASLYLEHEPPLAEQRILYDNHARFYADLLQEKRASDIPLRTAFVAVRFASIAGKLLTGSPAIIPVPHKPEDVGISEHWSALHAEAKVYLIRNSSLMALSVHCRRHLDHAAKYFPVFNTVVGISLKRLESEHHQQFVELETALILGDSALRK